MQFSDKVIHNAHRHTHGNEEALAKSDKAGCFNCLHVFDYFGVDLIKDWNENPLLDTFKAVQESIAGMCKEFGIEPKEISPPKRSAICPKCQCDTVLGSASGYPVSDPAFLKAMHNRWIRMTSGSKEDREQRAKLIAEARAAKKAFVILPPQNPDNLPKNSDFDLKPQTLLCLCCRMETFDPAAIARRYCGNCEKDLTNEITRNVTVEDFKAMKEELDANPPPENTIIIDTPSTGFPMFDENVKGFKKGQIINIIGAGVGVGKPSLPFENLEMRPVVDLEAVGNDQVHIYGNKIVSKPISEEKDKS